MNGLYKAKYQTPVDAGEGILFLDDGKIYGGDLSHAFYGTYNQSADVIKANIIRIQHSAGTTLGGNGDKITVTAKITENQIQGKGIIEGSNASMTITMNLFKNI